MQANEEAKKILAEAEMLYSADAVAATVHRLAGEIGRVLGDSYPVVLSVMGGAVVFTGQLLPQLDFPLDFDYIHVSRYGGTTRGGTLEWKVLPPARVAGRVVLVLDDILDEGYTLAAIREKLLEMGAQACYCAVFADKETGRPKPAQADFTGLRLPDRYVFGFGMDVHGAWRNLPGIYALAQSTE